VPFPGSRPGLEISMPLRGEHGKIIVPLVPCNPPRSPQAIRLGELMPAAC